MQLGGTTANIPVDDGLKQAVLGAAENGVRAIKVSVNNKPLLLVSKETIPASESFADDLEAIVASETHLENAAPCILLMRLSDEKKTVPGATEQDWGLLSWSPDDAPVRQKMIYTSSCKTLKDHLSQLRFKELKATEKSEINMSEILQKMRGLSRGMTREERHSVMTHEEIMVEEVAEQMETTRKSAPVKMAGLVALEVKRQESFDAAVSQLLTGDCKAVLARLAGSTHEELSGEALDDAALPSQLKGGRLPAHEPCYVIQKCQGSDDRLLLLSWLPDDMPRDLRMKCSTFKKSVKHFLDSKAGKVLTAEVTDEGDLTDDLGQAHDQEETAAVQGGKPGDAVAAGEASPKKAFKRPVGGMALPGMA